MGGLPACFAHQREVPFVQRAHGRNQGQRAIGFEPGDRAAQWIKLVHGLHALFPLGKTRLRRESARITLHCSIRQPFNCRV